MQLTKILTGQAMTIRLEGELDHHNAEKIRTVIDNEIESHDLYTVILDMEGVTFMDSSGLGVILGRYRLLQSRGGTLSICGVNNTVERILRMSGLYSLIRKIEKV